jgi:hypothetical protein
LALISLFRGNFVGVLPESAYAEGSKLPEGKTSGCVRKPFFSRENQGRILRRARRYRFAAVETTDEVTKIVCKRSFALRGRGKG